MAGHWTRRSFLKAGIVGISAAGFARPPLAGLGRGGGKDIDILIAGGRLYDGTGGTGREADVAIQGERILAVAQAIDLGRARRVIEARDMVVCPGFIDAHAHSDETVLANPHAENVVRQGVTTTVNGNCGSSPFPLSEYFRELRRVGTALNCVQLLGQGTVRGAVMGSVDRTTTADELARMKKIVADAMTEGAAGLSTGLEYPPGSYARSEEIVELAKEAGRFGRMYATHMRNEDDTLLEAMAEAIAIAKGSGTRLEISHLKTCYPRTWPKIDSALALLDRAQADGLAVQADCYPYTAGSTTLAIQFPLWAQQGTTAEFLSRLKDASLDEKLRAYVKERERKFGSWERLVISSVTSGKNKSLQGKSVAEAAAAQGKGAYEFMRDLLVEEQGNVGTVNFFMSEDNLKKKLRHPLIAIGSDGAVAAGPSGGDQGLPHPRSFGTFPRVLGKYVRDERVLTLENAIRKMTSLPARHFRLLERGEVREGFFADLVVFDPDKIADRATYGSPEVPPAGIRFVLVNGRTVISEEKPTGALPGRVLTPGISGS